MSLPAHRRWQLLWIALALLIAWRATAREERRGVLRDHIEFGHRLLQGSDPYAPWKSDLDAPLRPLHAPYPPSFGLLTAPFALVHDTLGLPATRCAWALLQLAALVALAAAMRWLAHGDRGRGTAEPDDAAHRWLLLGTFVLLARFLLRDTHGGGGNLINVALCTQAFVDAERGRGARSGLWLGISLATKPTQVWLLPVLWLMGHRRSVGWTLLVGAAGALASLALLRFDLAPWHRWLDGSLALAAQTDAYAVPALGFPEFDWMNQSLRCAVARWFGTVPPEFAARVVLGVPPGLGLPLPALAWIVRLVLATALTAVLVGAHRHRRSQAVDLAPDDGRRARTFVFAAALTFSLLASPLSWKAHHTALLPLVYLLLQRAVGRRSRALWALVALFGLACSVGKELLTDAGDELGNSLYLVTALDLVLLAAALRFAADPRPRTG